MTRRVTIRWTDTAKKQLAQLPPKVRKGLLEKADTLETCDDPRTAHKKLVGPLEGFYRITYSRYRAVYAVEEETLASGSILVHIKVHFVACGQRKERDKNDIYKIAQKLVQFGLVDVEREKTDEE